MDTLEFDLAKFLAKDPAEVDATEASIDFLRLGPALLKAVGYERDDDGDWHGQEKLQESSDDGELSLCFTPIEALGYAYLVEMKRSGGISSTYSREAYLPFSERAGHYSPRVATNLGEWMEVVHIPVPTETEPEHLERAYATAQSLTQEVLDHYGVTLEPEKGADIPICYT